MTTLPSLAARGFLPVTVDAERRTLVLAPLADLPFREATYARTLAAHGDRQASVVPVTAFVRHAAQLPPSSPAGVVSHVGRCGSTLLANLLALRPGTLVLKEPGFLNAAPPELLRALMTYCRAAASAAGRELVVKSTSWSSPALLAAAEPDDARWLLLWRDPVEVVRSALASPPPWADSDAAATAAVVLDGPTTRPAVRYARQWDAIARAFLRTDLPVRFLEYARLAAGKGTALRAVQRWLALRDADTVPDAFATEADRYSKAADGTRFDPSARHHRPDLTPADTAAVLALTRETLGALRVARPLPGAPGSP